MASARGPSARLNGVSSKLTPQQAAVLECIRGYRREYHEAPTVSFVARRLGLSRKRIYDHLDALVRKGRLKHASPAAQSATEARA